MLDASATVEPAADSYPARLDIDYPEEGLSRASTLFRVVLVIPIGVVAGLLTTSFVRNWQVDEMDWAGLIAGITLFGPTLLMLLFRQKYPRWWFDWNLELTRFTTRVFA
ncbi:MAG: hypothetical protein OXH54_06555 [Acidimicrobiaceae bacterium]|nr:hypothetical protein [Acidimicrobiaceae bacterium]